MDEHAKDAESGSQEITARSLNILCRMGFLKFYPQAGQAWVEYQTKALRTHEPVILKACAPTAEEALAKLMQMVYDRGLFK